MFSLGQHICTKGKLCTVHQTNLGSRLAFRERKRISDSLELMPEPMTPFLARGNRARMASEKQRRAVEKKKIGEEDWKRRRGDEEA